MTKIIAELIIKKRKRVSCKNTYFHKHCRVNHHYSKRVFGKKRIHMTTVIAVDRHRVRGFSVRIHMTIMLIIAELIIICVRNFYKNSMFIIIAKLIIIDVREFSVRIHMTS